MATVVAKLSTAQLQAEIVRVIARLKRRPSNPAYQITLDTLMAECETRYL